MKDELLEYVYKKSDVTYISDLRSPINIAKNMHIIAGIKDDLFNIEEWNLFASYVIGVKICEDTIANVIHKLESYSNYIG